MTRPTLNEAAQSMLFHSTRWSWLKARAMKIAGREDEEGRLSPWYFGWLGLRRSWADGTEFR